jgi:inner membrane protein
VRRQSAATTTLWKGAERRGRPATPCYDSTVSIAPRASGASQSGVALRLPPHSKNMATILSHAIAALSIGTVFPRPKTARFWIGGALLSAIPDIDVLGFRFGIHYGDVLGHRGLTHSLFIAFVLGSCAATFVWSREKHAMPWAKFWLYFFIAAASHGILDAFTNGGLGVAFFAPFSNTRYFFPFRPIEVSPIGFGALLTARGFAVLKSEALWIWMPSALFAAAMLAARRLVRLPAREGK